MRKRTINIWKTSYTWWKLISPIHNYIAFCSGILLDWCLTSHLYYISSSGGSITRSKQLNTKMKREKYNSDLRGSANCWTSVIRFCLPASEDASFTCTVGHVTYPYAIPVKAEPNCALPSPYNPIYITEMNHKIFSAFGHPLLAIKFGHRSTLSLVVYSHIWSHCLLTDETNYLGC